MEGFSFVTPITGLNRPSTGKEDDNDDDDDDLEITKIFRDLADHIYRIS
jgi:hypothetical protein